MKKILIAIIVASLLTAVYVYFFRDGGVATDYGAYVVYDKSYSSTCSVISIERRGNWWNENIGSFKICKEKVKQVYEAKGWVYVEMGCGYTWKKELETGKMDTFLPENKCSDQIIP